MIDISGYVPEGMDIEEWGYEISTPRNMAVITGKIVLFMERTGSLETSADTLVDLLDFSKLFAPEDANEEYGTSVRMIACDAINTYVARLKPDDFIKVRPQIQTLLADLQNESTQVIKNDNPYPFVNIYSLWLSADLVWMIQPFSMKLINQQMKAVIDFQTGDSAKIAVPRHNRFTSWDFLLYNSDHLPYYHSYLTYINATAINIACQLYRLDHGKLPDSLDELVPKYLPQLPQDLTPKTPKPILLQTMESHNAPRPILAFDISSNNFVFQKDLFRADGTHPAKFWIDLSAQPIPESEGLGHSTVPEPE